MKKTFTFLFLINIFIGIPWAVKAQERDTIITYSVPSDIPLSSIYKVTVNGIPLKVQKDGTRSYVHFSFAGTANIKITVSEGVNTFKLSPASHKIPAVKNGSDITFTIITPEKLIL